MVVRLDDGVMMGDQDVLTADDGADARALGQLELLDPVPNDLARRLVAMRDRRTCRSRLPMVAC